MEWEDAIPDPLHPALLLTKRSNPIAEFAYTDLGSIMHAAQAFCDKNELILETSYLSHSHMARVFPGNVAIRDGLTWEGSAYQREAIMFACISAARKLKARAA